MSAFEKFHCVIYTISTLTMNCVNTMSESEFIDHPPSPSSLIASLRNIGYTFEAALADIVDNSISAEASHIEVLFRNAREEPWLAVIDDGSGMSEAELVYAMRFGSKSPVDERDPHDLGRFGLG